jgi:hypothetical protein
MTTRRSCCSRMEVRKRKQKQKILFEDAPEKGCVSVENARRRMEKESRWESWVDAETPSFLHCLCTAHETLLIAGNTLHLLGNGGALSARFSLHCLDTQPQTSFLSYNTWHPNLLQFIAQYSIQKATCSCCSGFHRAGAALRRSHRNLREQVSIGIKGTYSFRDSPSQKYIVQYKYVYV